MTEAGRPLRHQVVASFTISLGALAAALNTATGLYDSAAGDFLLAGALASCAAPFLLDRTLSRGFRPVLAAFTALFAVYAVSTLGDPEPRAAVHTGVIGLIAVYVAALYQYGDRLPGAGGFAVLLICAGAALTARVVYFPYDRLGPETSPWHWRIYQYAAAAAQVFLALACVAIRRRAAPVWLVVGAAVLGSFLLAYAAGARVQIAASLGLIPAFLWFYHTRRAGPWLAYLPLIALLAFAGYLTFFLAALSQFLIGIVGGGTFAFGLSVRTPREGFWPVVLDLILAKPYFGYGAGTILRDVSDITFSTHSHFLQVALQTGAVGLAAFILLLAALWVVLHRQEDATLRALGLAVLTSVIVVNLFGITLLQNAVSIGVLQWTVIGLCMCPRAGARQPAPAELRPEGRPAPRYSRG